MNKGIILAGGNGSRLSPLTKAVSKQLIPIYDKPLIYYSLSVLMLAKIRSVELIVKPNDLEKFEILFGDGEILGMDISYALQPTPNGLAEAFLISEQFINWDPVALILGDNFFFGTGFPATLEQAKSNKEGATIFCHGVSEPENFGVVQLNEKGRPVSIEEKPENPKSNLAVTGLYFYDSTVVERAKEVMPSARGELEITSINNSYLEDNQLNVEVLGRGFTWLDAGTFENVANASHFVSTIEKRQGYKIGCIEEIALVNKWIDETHLVKSIDMHGSSDYGKYLRTLID